MQAEWNQVRADGKAGGGRFPLRVERAMARFLGCGSLARGFGRLRCDGCREELLVPFSCKQRALCPSCDGRRMAEQAARLCDEVLPVAPMRQYVLSLPHALRYRLAWDHGLLSEVLAIWAREIERGLLRRAATHLRDASVLRIAAAAGFTGIQRFGDALRLNPHLHTVFADGVWLPQPGSELPRFVRVRAPSQGEVEALAVTVRRKVLRRLARLGVLRDVVEAEPALFDDFAEREPLLAHCVSANVLDRVALGERAGELVLRLCEGPVEVKPNGKRCAIVDGFSVHAATAVATRDRERLESLCKYILRPAVCNERMEPLGDGRVLVRLKQRWNDGTYAKVFEPRDLLTKVVALMPGHGVNLLRYHGQLAPAARWRRLLGPRVVAEPTAATASRAAAASTRPVVPPSTRLGWAELLKRSFAVDVLQCACGGRRRLVAVIEQREVVCKILTHLGLPTDAPEFAAARGPPLLALAEAAVSDERRVELDAEFVEPEI